MTLKVGDKGTTKGGFPYQIIDVVNHRGGAYFIAHVDDSSTDGGEWGFRPDGTVNLPAELKAVLQTVVGIDPDDLTIDVGTGTGNG